MRTSTITTLRFVSTVLVTALASTLTACGGSGWNPNTPDQAATAEAPAPTSEPTNDAAATVARFRAKDPALSAFFENCHGYAVFPTVGKGGFWIGGAHGKGEVYEQGQLVGKAALTQLTAGPQVGGQAYSEIIFFENAAALRDFKNGNFELGAQVSAIAVDEGGAHHAAYDDNVAVFTLAKGGLMAEATVAGQKFAFNGVTGKS
jgi:lipid-binding SYLF domain-containing protein